MKAYTLRMDDKLLTALKELGIREHKSMRDILLDAIADRLDRGASRTRSLKERQSWEKASRLARCIPLKNVVSALREDRDR